MNRSTRNWIEGNGREMKAKPADEAGRVVVHAALVPDGRDEQTASPIKRVISKIKSVLGQ